jgi:hypothetical protein
VNGGAKPLGGAASGARREPLGARHASRSAAALPLSWTHEGK